jgi:hypothetical protein
LGDGAGVLEDEHHLEQRVAGEGAIGLEGVNELFEREFLVGVGGEVELADPAEEFAEGGLPGEIGAEDEGVDVEADLVVKLFVEATSDGAAEGDVGAGAESGEEDGERGLQGHEEAGPLLAGEGLQAGVQGRGDVAGDGSPAVGRLAGTGAIGGEGEFFGNAGESVLPEGEFPGENAVGLVGRSQPALLPEGVVGVLDGERPPGGGCVCAASGVGGGEIVPERGERRAIASDVMQHQQQDVLGGTEGEDPYPQGKIAIELEGEIGGVAEPSGEFRSGDRLNREGELEGLEREDLLPGDTRGGGDESAEGLVTTEEIAKGEAEGVEIEGATQAVCQRDVVSGTGTLELFEEPHSLLGGGEGELVGARLWPQEGADDFW